MFLNRREGQDVFHVILKLKQFLRFYYIKIPMKIRFKNIVNSAKMSQKYPKISPSVVFSPSFVEGKRGKKCKTSYMANRIIFIV